MGLDGGGSGATGERDALVHGDCGAEMLSPAEDELVVADWCGEFGAADLTGTDPGADAAGGGRRKRIPVQIRVGLSVDGVVVGLGVVSCAGRYGKTASSKTMCLDTITCVVVRSKQRYPLCSRG